VSSSRRTLSVAASGEADFEDVETVGPEPGADEPEPADLDGGLLGSLTVAFGWREKPGSLVEYADCMAIVNYSFDRFVFPWVD